MRNTLRVLSDRLKALLTMYVVLPPPCSDVAVAYPKVLSIPDYEDIPTQKFVNAKSALANQRQSY